MRACVKRLRFRAHFPIRPHTFVFPSAGSCKAVVSYWQIYVHEVLGLSLPRKSVVRLTDRPEMTLAVSVDEKKPLKKHPHPPKRKKKKKKKTRKKQPRRNIMPGSKNAGIIVEEKLDLSEDWTIVPLLW